MVNAQDVNKVLTVTENLRKATRKRAEAAEELTAAQALQIADLEAELVAAKAQLAAVRDI